MEFNGLYNRACSRLMYFSDSSNTSANVQSVSKIYLRVVNYEDTLEFVSYAIFYQRCTSEANMPSNKLASPPCCCNVAHSKYRLIPLVCPVCLRVFVIKQTSRSLRNANLQWLRCGWLVTKVLYDSHSLMQAFGYRFCRSIVFPMLLISLLRLPYKNNSLTCKTRLVNMYFDCGSDAPTEVLLLVVRSECGRRKVFFFPAPHLRDRAAGERSQASRQALDCILSCLPRLHCGSCERH